MPAPSVANSPQKQWPSEGLENVSRCPICDSDRRQLAYAGLTDRVFNCAPGEWTLYCCGNCQSAYLDPRPKLSAMPLAYANYYTHEKTGGAKEGRTSRWKQRRIAQRNYYLNTGYGYNLAPARKALFPLSNSRRHRFDRYVGYLPFPGPQAQLLDIGCGNGSFLQQMQSLGWKVCGIEPDHQSAEQAQAAGLDIRVGQLPEVSLPKAHFDAITLSHVIEHLHNPIEVLNHCWQLLKPDGKIVVFTPNYNARGRVLFGPYWRGLEPPRHLILFTESSLRKAMEQCGFSVSKPLQACFNARAMFRMSWLLRCNEPGSPEKHRLPWYLRLRCDWLAYKANAAARADSTLAEELILLGAKKETD